jgi:hypothetical protein
MNNSDSTSSPVIPITSSAAQPTTTIREVIANQSFAGGFICPDCKFYKGGVGCEKNMFISFTGCWTKDCSSFKQK